MSDLAQSGATTSSEPHVAMAIMERLLPLNGNIPVSVYVRLNPSATKVEFSTDRTIWYDKGMSWECGDEYALFITYVLTTQGIELVPKEVNPKLWFSPVLPATPGADSTQLGCVYPVGGTFHFRVQTPPKGDGVLGDYIDPQIVVTPITMGCSDRERSSRT
jgi:hypothetical protein